MNDCRCVGFLVHRRKSDGDGSSARPLLQLKRNESRDDWRPLERCRQGDRSSSASSASGHTLLSHVASPVLHRAVTRYGRLLAARRGGGLLLLAVGSSQHRQAPHNPLHIRPEGLLHFHSCAHPQRVQYTRQLTHTRTRECDSIRFGLFCEGNGVNARQTMLRCAQCAE